MKKRNISCTHIKENRKLSIYNYEFGEFSLSICPKCERELRKKIIQQIKDEEEVRINKE